MQYRKQLKQFLGGLKLARVLLEEMPYWMLWGTVEGIGNFFVFSHVGRNATLSSLHMNISGMNISGLAPFTLFHARPVFVSIIKTSSLVFKSWYLPSPSAPKVIAGISSTIATNSLIGASL